MIEFYVDKIIKNQYFLSDIQDQQHVINLVFYSKVKPQAGDKIIMHRDLLNPDHAEFCQPYFFGEIDDQTGNEGDNLQDRELLLFSHNGKKYLVKRLYG